MKLTKNNAQTVESIVDFICTLIFKDEIKAFSEETQLSAEKASIYLSAYLKTDKLNETQRQNILDTYVELNPYYRKLEVDYNIPPHISRLTKDMDIMYQPDTMIIRSPYLYHYRTIYKQCLQSFYITSYSPAMLHKDNYRNLCLLSINLMAFLQLIAKWLENPYDIEMMNEVQVNRFITSFGISFFNDLSFKYKQAIARNLNRLISSKGTDKVIIDILEIFNYSSITVSKYYLVRDSISMNDYANNIKDFRNASETDMYFISHDVKLPSLTHAIKNELHTKFPFEQITKPDPFWNVEKEELTKLDFDFIETKYFSIETGFDLSAEVINTAFAINLLKRIRTDYPSREVLTANSNLISDTNSVKIEDVIIAMQILMCEYQGLQDVIQYDLVGIAKTYEFAKNDPLNMNMNLMKVAPIIKNENDIKMANLDTVTEFSPIVIEKIFDANLIVKKNMEKYLKDEIDYQAYKKIKTAHNAKFYQDINYDMYNGAKTLTDYLFLQNKDLHIIISRIREIEDEVEKRKEIERTMSGFGDIVIQSLQELELFFSISTANIALDYIKRIILTFKSFTTSLVNLNIFIVMREQYFSKLIDKLERISGYFTLDNDHVFITDNSVYKGFIFIKSKLYVLDFCDIVLATMEFYTTLNVADDYKVNASISRYSKLDLSTAIKESHTSLVNKEKLNINEYQRFTISREFQDNSFKFRTFVKTVVKLASILDNFKIKDTYFKFSTTMEYSSILTSEDDFGFTGAASRYDFDENTSFKEDLKFNRTDTVLFDERLVFENSIKRTTYLNTQTNLYLNDNVVIKEVTY